MSLEVRKAQRKQAKLKVGLSGPSGSGKTYSALLLANGITSWDKIVVIDTENGSGELYTNLGDYNVITLEAPFTPERYIEAIQACEGAGMEVIIVDSVSHEWDGKGGCLEIQEKLGGRFQDWAKVTPRHRSFIEAILQAKAHVITTVRNKQDYQMTHQDGKVRVEKVGLKEVTREGFEYELTLNFEIDIRHNAKAGKDRTGLFMDQPEFTITKDTGKQLLAWAESGEKDEPTKEQTKRFDELLKELGGTREQMEAAQKGKKWEDLTQRGAATLIASLEKKLADKDRPGGDGGTFNSDKFIDDMEKDKNGTGGGVKPETPSTTASTPEKPAEATPEPPVEQKPVPTDGNFTFQLIENDVATQYSFEKFKCISFTKNGKHTAGAGIVGKEFTENWRKQLELSGFKLV